MDDGGADAAETAARQMIATDADDWRGYVALARALTVRKPVSAVAAAALDADGWDGFVALSRVAVARPPTRVPEAITAARQAVALAPDEPEARLALADALLAAVPRRLRTRAAAFAELDRAELLGVDAADLVERRKTPKRPAFYAVYYTCGFLFMIFGLDERATTLSRAIAWPCFTLFLLATFAYRLRAQGDSFAAALDLKRQLSRHRLSSPERVSQSAPTITFALAPLVLPGAFLAIPAVDGDPQARWAVWPLLIGIPLICAAVWIGIDRWLWPGTVIRVLRHDAFVTAAVSGIVVLALASPALVLFGVHRPGIWFTLFLTQLAWAFGAFSGPVVASRRKKRASAPGGGGAIG